MQLNIKASCGQETRLWLYNCFNLACVTTPQADLMPSLSCCFLIPTAKAWERDRETETL